MARYSHRGKGYKSTRKSMMPSGVGSRFHRQPKYRGFKKTPKRTHRF